MIVALEPKLTSCSSAGDRVPVAETLCLIVPVVAETTRVVVAAASAEPLDVAPTTA